MVERSHGEVQLDELARFFELSPDLLCIANMQGYFVRLSPSWELLLGYSIDELLAHPFIDFVHPDDVAATNAEAGRLSQGEETVEFENRYRCRDGSYRWFRWNARAWPESGLIYAIARDTSERKRLEQELAEARDRAVASSQLKSNLLAALTAQLRDPLELLLDGTRLLLGSAMSTGQRQIAESVRRRGTELLRSLGELVEYLSLESGPPRSRGASVELRRWLAELVEPFQARASSLGLGFELTVSEELAHPAVIDIPRVQQVLAQILTLALESTREGGVRFVAGPGLLRERPALRLEIRDTGVGMAPERIEHLMAPVDGAAHPGRVGLGLAIAKQLVDLMGGALEAHSTPGLGSTVAVTVPMAVLGPVGPAVETVRAANQTPGEAVSGTPAQPAVLVVDENAVSRQHLGRLLGEVGFLAVPVPNRSAARHAFERHGPAVVLLDIALEEREGYPTVRELRDRQWSQRPIALIAVTADSRPGTRTRCLEAGLDDVVTKPVERQDLAAAVRRGLERASGADPPRADGDHPVDLSRIREAADGEPAFQRKLIRLFVADMERHLEAMREAFQGNDVVELKRRAHSVKGTAGHLGAGFIGELAADLEGGSTLDALEASRSCFGRLESEFQRARTFLEAYFVALEPAQG